MPSFSFNIPKAKLVHKDKPKKSKPSQKDVIGVVWINLKAEYSVEVNGIRYDITADSYSCKGKNRVYRQAYPHSIRCLVARLGDNLSELDNKFWLPFAPGDVVKGDIVNMNSFKQEFKINKINDYDLSTKANDAFVFYRQHKEEIDDVIRSKQFCYD